MGELREEYKMTELGEIPCEWEVTKLGDLFKLKSGENLSAKNQIHGPYPVYGGNGISGYHDSFIFDESKLVIGRVGALCGNVFITEEKSWITDNALYLAEVLKPIDNKYMFYLLSSLNLNAYANKNAQPVISGRIIYEISVVYPTIQEQQKIASILSIVDEQIDETEQLIVKTKELKKGLMQQLLTKGIGHTEFKQTELGEIPTKWNIYVLEQIVTVLDGMRKPIKKNDRKSGNIPYYGATGIIDLVDDYIFDEELILVGEDGENLRSRVLPMAFKVVGKSWVNNHAHVLKPIQSVHIDYLTFYLESISYDDYITGSAQPKLNQAQLKKIKTLVPPFEEQQKIAEILSTVDEQIEVYEQEKVKYEELKKGLMQQLLTGQIRVKI